MANDSLKRAIESLGAVEVPGHPGKWAIHREGGWVLIRERGCLCGTGSGLVDWLELFAGFEPTPELLAPVLCHAIEAPAWWSPQQQYATISEAGLRAWNADDAQHAREQHIDAFRNDSDALTTERILQVVTCDLLSGGEVPC